MTTFYVLLTLTLTILLWISCCFLVVQTTTNHNNNNTETTTIITTESTTTTVFPDCHAVNSIVRVFNLFDSHYFAEYRQQVVTYWTYNRYLGQYIKADWLYALTDSHLQGVVWDNENKVYVFNGSIPGQANVIEYDKERDLFSRLGEAEFSEIITRWDRFANMTFYQTNMEQYYLNPEGLIFTKNNFDNPAWRIEAHLLPIKGIFQYQDQVYLYINHNKIIEMSEMTKSNKTYSFEEFFACTKDRTIDKPLLITAIVQAAFIVLLIALNICIVSQSLNSRGKSQLKSVRVDSMVSPANAPMASTISSIVQSRVKHFLRSIIPGRFKRSMTSRPTSTSASTLSTMQENTFTEKRAIK